MSRKLFLGLAIAAALTACKNESATTDAAAPAKAASHAFSPAIAEADFAEMVKVLSSDEFEGRAPGSVGEDKTVEYIVAQFERIGLQPGNNGSWFQEVPMVETTADESATALRLTQGGETRELAFGTDYVVGTRTGQADINLKDSELVFVGYGVNAPERDWNDYGDADWTRKTVVMFVNDPGFHANDEALFDGNKMTYYGRWTYKFEEAARRGASAALIVHDNAGASYGWDVVKNSWSGPQYDLLPKDDPDPRLPAQGWLSADAARQLFAGAGLDLDEAYKAANKPGFKPVPLNATLALDLKSSSVEKISRNVVGVLPGSTHPDEAVLYIGHWDHLGKHEGEDDADTIYNGAIDNATGIAGIIEIAEAFANQETPPQRSIGIVAVTLEESGLLGSKYYVAHPTFALDKIAGVINLDAMSVAGRSRDFVVTGQGNSELEDILKPIAEAQGRTLAPEGNTAGGFYFRSDHFNFAKAGVPALYAKGGSDLVEGGTEAGKLAGQDYAKRYHQPSDEIHDGWRYDGVVEDLDALYQVGQVISAPGNWPNWYEGNPFKAARDEMMAEKAKTAE